MAEWILTDRDLGTDGAYYNYPELIRCKDCVHHHYESKTVPYCDLVDYGYGWEDTDFCSRAERKTE